ncbi:S46 family peptidase [Carboxylicivirga sediminis]|uniref:Dipeptidyl-peptidase n=1 Tax=Carboxylicivirga sediminis TaxID=2006564 RepID=A0A941IWG2_9BACT|nr:S46 family peptidase [Carboxylicivirga sediminis]MBR8534374.1 S46 family peptidase [Carboxylicivirga sediminis]
MRKIAALLLISCLGFVQFAKADEGMWLLPLINKLNIEKMQEMGFQLSAEDVYSINNSSLKDAIVIFGRGCTGEMISDQGLLLTNHHCGYGNIQELSSVEHNYLKDGFWAKSLEEELPAPGLTVTFLKYMTDVTEKITAELNDEMSEADRAAKIKEVSAKLVEEAKEGNEYQIRVQDYFEGNQFFLIAYETFEDVRFVGAPPSSIGKFGFDTDNWMWPRHTGDFSMFRVYCGPDGKPAKYSKDNKPYKPAHHLPVSLKGVEMDDYAMTIGFPGSTERYLTSWGITERMDIINHARIKPRGIKQDIWLKDMRADEKVNIQYASKFARSSNYWKNSIGMNRGLEKLNVLGSKRELENEFTTWVNADAQRKEKYGNVLNELEKAYEARAPFMSATSFLLECQLRGAEVFYFALNAQGLEKALEEEDQEKINKAVEGLKKAGEGFFKDYYPETDRKVIAALLKLYNDDIDAQYHPSFYADVNKKFKGDFQKFADNVYSKSVFMDEARFNAFLEKPSLKVLQKDLAYIAGMSSLNKYREIKGMEKESAIAIDKNNRLFIAGLMEMQPDKVFYPDANFTMRLSYGKVGDYEPKDGVIYKHFTTIEGIMEKEDPDNFEFEVPAKLKELWKNKDYGQYADAAGYMPVCFTSNNDITGGNSGSPVINAEGHLFGLAFDGNWEAMSGDIAFETELQKCINVDIRYVLFIIDKYAGATNLIDEMTLVK